MAHPVGISAVGELENHVEPRAETPSNVTETPVSSGTVTLAPSCVFAKASPFQLSVDAAPARSKSHDSLVAVQAPIGSVCESRIAAATRPSIAAALVLGVTAYPRRVRSDDRCA